MSKEYEQPKCYGCQQKIKFKKGDKTRLNLDGSIHHCPPDETDSEPAMDEIIKSRCIRCKNPIFRVVGTELYCDDYDLAITHECKGNLVVEEKGETIATFQTGDKAPVRPAIRITKIIVSRTLSINYGVATQYSTEKEAILNSMTIGYESETSANFEQAELVTHDLMNQLNHAIKTEFTDKYKLRMLKSE